MTEIYVVLHTLTFAFHYFHVHLSLTKFFCTKKKPFLQFGGNFFPHVQVQNLATITGKFFSLYISTKELHYNHLPIKFRTNNDKSKLRTKRTSKQLNSLPFNFIIPSNLYSIYALVVFVLKISALTRSISEMSTNCA